MTGKNCMGWATHARSQSRFHEIFSCPFVHFVVQKEFLMLPADALQKKTLLAIFSGCSSQK
jgi:hypothetical protein